jgi:hypothetical protein
MIGSQSTNVQFPCQTGSAGGIEAGADPPQWAEKAKKSEVQKAAPSACYRNMLCLQHPKALHMDPMGPGRECSVRIV